MAERKKKTVGRPFKKGQSGNPGGKTKELVRLEKEAKRLFAESVPVAHAFIMQTLEDEGATWGRRFACAKLVFEYGKVKPKTVMAGDGDDPLFDTAAIAESVAKKLNVGND